MYSTSPRPTFEVVACGVTIHCTRRWYWSETYGVTGCTVRTNSSVTSMLPGNSLRVISWAAVLCSNAMEAGLNASECRTITRADKLFHVGVDQRFPGLHPRRPVDLALLFDFRCEFPLLFFVECGCTGIENSEFDASGFDAPQARVSLGQGMKSTRQRGCERTSSEANIASQEIGLRPQRYRLATTLFILKFFRALVAKRQASS
jgi:hypothetical protein